MRVLCYFFVFRIAITVHVYIFCILHNNLSFFTFMSFYCIIFAFIAFFTVFAFQAMPALSIVDFVWKITSMSIWRYIHQCHIVNKSERISFLVSLTFITYYFKKKLTEKKKNFSQFSAKHKNSPFLNCFAIYSNIRWFIGIISWCIVSCYQNKAW